MKVYSVFSPTYSDISETEDGFFLTKFGIPTPNEKVALDEAHWMMDSFETIKKTRPDRPVKVIVDMSSIDDSEYIPGEVWKIYLALVKDPFLERVAVVGGTDAMRNIINFYFRFWAREDVKFVEHISDAVQYLSEEKKG